MRGRPLGFGIETQAREEAVGLNSARGRMRVRFVVIGFEVSMVAILGLGFAARGE